MMIIESPNITLFGNKLNNTIDADGLVSNLVYKVF